MELVDVVISSPPYADVSLDPGDKCRPEAKIERLKKEGKFREAEIIRRSGSGHANNLRQQEYGFSDGQLGTLRAGDPPMTAKTKKRKILQTQWFHCHDAKWDDFISKDATSHPAKFARGLVERIVKHMFDRGYVKKGDTVADPFGGVATAGLVCAYRGLRWVGCELEPKFRVLAHESMLQHASRLCVCDERGKTWLAALKESVKDKEELENAKDEGRPAKLSDPKTTAWYKGLQQVVGGGDGKADVYCKKCGKLALRPMLFQGDSRKLSEIMADAYSAVMSSPPYADLPIDSVVSSPPFAATIKGKHEEKETASQSKKKRKTSGGPLGQSLRNGGYGTTDGNLSQLPEKGCDALVAQPPNRNSITDSKTNTGSHADNQGDWAEGRKRAKIEGATNTPGNLAKNDVDEETFWSAAKVILAQCHSLLKPGGVAVFNCKDFVRDKTRVCFSDDWVKLCEHCGFVLIERYYAMLKQTSVKKTLFGDKQEKKKQKKSFFKLLGEKKGSPEINWEDVLIFKKPDDAARGSL